MTVPVLPILPTSVVGSYAIPAWLWAAYEKIEAGGFGAMDLAETENDAVETAIRGLEGPLEMRLRKFVAVLYVAEMGRPQGIPLFDSLVLLGRERSLQRLRTARARLE